MIYQKVLLSYLFRVENEITDRWMFPNFVPSPHHATCATLPQLSSSGGKALKVELENRLQRQLSAVSSSRIVAFLEERRKNRKFSVPTTFPWTQSGPAKTPACGPMKCEDDDDDDDYEEYPYEYVSCSGCERQGHSELM